VFQACNVSTANLSDVKVGTTLNSDGECASDNASFPASSPVIFCSAKLKNAPSDTKVTFQWHHGSDDMGKASVSSGSGVVNSNFKPSGELPPGKYSVTVKIETDNATPVTKEFTVE